MEEGGKEREKRRDELDRGVIRRLTCRDAASALASPVVSCALKDLSDEERRFAKSGIVCLLIDFVLLVVIT